MLSNLCLVVKMISKCAVASLFVLSLFAVISEGKVEEFNQNYLQACYEADAHVGLSAGKFVSDSHQWPFLVALFHKKEQRFICGGSLVTPSHILTAAHCLRPKTATQPIDPDDLIVYLGTDDLSDENEASAVAVNATKFYIHDDWNSMDRINYDADIAVVRLETKIAGISPVCLWTNEEEEEVEGGIVVGW
jgi:V8-like Glu-specific endopeptidase